MEVPSSFTSRGAPSQSLSAKVMISGSSSISKDARYSSPSSASSPTGKTICIQMLKCQTCAHIGIAVEVVYVTIIGIVTAKTGSLGSVNTTNLIDNAQRGQDG